MTNTQPSETCASVLQSIDTISNLTFNRGHESENTCLSFVLKQYCNKSNRKL